MKRLVPTVVPAVPAAEPAGARPIVSDTLVFNQGDTQSNGRSRNPGTSARANGRGTSVQEPKRSLRSTARHAEEVSEMPQQYKEVSKKVKQWRIAVGNESGGVGNDPSMYERDHRMAEMQDQIEELQHLFRNHESRMSSFRKQQEDRYEETSERIEMLTEQIFRLEKDRERITGPNAIALSRVDITSADRQDLTHHLASLPKTPKQIEEEKEMKKMKHEPVQHDLEDSESDDSQRSRANQVVEYENKMDRLAQIQEKMDEEKDKYFEEGWQWKSTAENAYGAFIQKGMQDSLTQAMLQCGLMVFLSWIVQFVITYELFNALPDLDEPAAFGHCTNPSSLQLASLGVWLLTMFNNVSQMMQAAMICLFADTEKTQEEKEVMGEDGKPKQQQVAVCHHIQKAVPVRVFIFFYAVLSEMTIWAFLLYTGVMFILTAETPVLIVRSTVAITFIQQIDELIYGACATANIKEQVSGTKYQVRYSTLWCGMKLRTIFEVEWNYSLYCHLLVLIGLAFGVLFMARLFEPIKCGSVWQAGVGDPTEYLDGY